MKKIRPIALYLPQFHPIPENDEWWGKGFTEWTNVVKAQPLFEGHYQPHLPADLGFYDLRLPEARIAQAELAKQYGIYGFCYYHYWFNGRRILERPFQEVFESGKPDFPFMLCWANENWTRTWDGEDKHVLLEQKYGDEDDRKHIQSLLPYFKDERYIKIDGKPVFAIYKSTALPDLKRTVEIWREEARKQGIELYLCRIETRTESGKSYLEDVLDASIDFQPFSEDVGKYNTSIITKQMEKLSYRLKRKLFSITKMEKQLRNQEPRLYEGLSNIDYNDYVDFILNNTTYSRDYVFFPGITPSWDNTARKKENSYILRNANPSKYKEWLSFIYKEFKPTSREENLVFINAWNEWAEGNHLEPCQKWGLQYLEATKIALEENG